MKLNRLILIGAIGLASACSQTITAQKAVPAITAEEGTAVFKNYEILSASAKRVVRQQTHCGANVFERSSDLLGPPKQAPLRKQYYEVLVHMHPLDHLGYVSSFYDFADKALYVVVEPDTQDLEKIAEHLRQVAEGLDYKIVPKCRTTRQLQHIENEIRALLEKQFPQNQVSEINTSESVGMVLVYLDLPDWRLQHLLLSRFGETVFARYRPEIETEFD